MWILDEKAEEGAKIIKKEITYVPGLYKIFDEILGKRKNQHFSHTNTYTYVYSI